jgi:hypothetical protein
MVERKVISLRQWSGITVQVYLTIDGKNTSSPGMRPVNSRIDPGEETITPDRTNVTLFTITLDEKQQFLDQDAWIVADLSQVFS